MKHNIKVTLVLISMFLFTQLIGLAVMYAYTPIISQEITNGTVQNITLNPLPYGMQPPEVVEQADFWTMLPSIAVAFFLAILFVFFLTKLKAAMIIKWWFFIVVVIVLGITFNAVLMNLLPYYDFKIISLSELVALAIALPLAIYKIFKRNILIHNLTELLIYPGIAVVFVPILNIWTTIVLLIAISIYDMWAVWHSGFMQKMAKFQMDHLKIFTGFFVPYLNKKQRDMIKEAKASKSDMKNKLKDKKMKVNVAILGGGDVVFPIITAGVVLRSLGLIPALVVTLFSTIALFVLFVFAKKGKFYPAMPFLTAGLLAGIGIAYLVA
ncbi:MAG TPA: presenilin family intramembrane aspartyl protease [Candidatus Paceibacterota bacterium]|nr:presenilin family intramembrane aspartyl protease [Candidatus Paceibacterota bacterium]